MSKDTTFVCGSYALSLSSTPIKVEEALEFVQNDECGAVYMFLGITRNTERYESNVSAIESLYYESYSEMAIKTMKEIVDKEMAKSPEVRKCYINHRLGCVEVGKPSIVIAACSIHRQEAHEIVIKLLNKIKETVPIWKRVQFSDGSKQTWSEKSEAFWLKKQ